MLAEPISTRVKQYGFDPFRREAIRRVKCNPTFSILPEKLHQGRSPDTIGRSITPSCCAASFISSLSTVTSAGDITLRLGEVHDDINLADGSAAGCSGTAKNKSAQ